MNSRPHPPPYSYKKGNAISLTMINTQGETIKTDYNAQTYLKEKKQGGEWKAREKIKELFFPPCNAF